MSTGADWAAAPILETMKILASVVDDDELNTMTIESPNCLTVPLTCRSGLMAPLHRNTLVPVTLPDCSNEAAAGSISYQRTSAPAPPSTVCWVHSPTLFACPGSI